MPGGDGISQGVVEIKAIPDSHGENSSFTGRISNPEHPLLWRAGFPWRWNIKPAQKESNTVWEPQVLHAPGTGKFLILVEQKWQHLRKKIPKCFQAISLWEAFSFIFTSHAQLEARGLNDRKQA